MVLVSYCHVCFSNLKMRLFSHVSVIFIFILNEWPETNSRNAILNNFDVLDTTLLCEGIINKGKYLS